MDGTPDYIAIKTANEGWWLKWRSSAQATVGFKTIGAVMEHVASLQRRRDTDDEGQYDEHDDEGEYHVHETEELEGP